MNYSEYPIYQNENQMRYNTMPCMKETSSNEIRFTSMECRIENLEKLLKFFEKLLTLKEEERKNDFNITANETFCQFSEKIDLIENKMNSVIQSQKKEIDSLKQEIENLNAKVDKYKSLFEEQKKMQEETKVFLSEKIGEIDGMINKNETIIDNIINERCTDYNFQIESKIQSILTVVEGMNKNTEENDFNINDLRDNFRRFQEENLKLVRIIEVQNTKINSIDFLNEQIKLLKERFIKNIKHTDDNNVKLNDDDSINNYIN